MVKDLCFEIIEKCLNNCKFCSSNSNCNKDKIIKYVDFKRTIDYFMKNGGIEEISFSGGEPFLHPNLYNMVKYVKELGIKTVIFTSGVIGGKPLSEELKETMLHEMNKTLEIINQEEPDNTFLKEVITRSYINKIEIPKFSPISREELSELKKLGLDKIVFDFQAYEADTDYLIMGRYEKSRQALLDSLYIASIVGLEVDVHFIPMKPNYKEIKEILELLEIIKIKNISILNFLPQGRGKINNEQLQLSNEEKMEFFEILNNSRKYYSGNIRIGIPLQNENLHKCNAGLEKLDIKFDGSILPCPAFKEITLEECKKFNIEIPNIYDSLDKVKIKGKGTRVVPLCKQIYNSRK